jgi:hypothetical protein
MMWQVAAGVILGVVGLWLLLLLLGLLITVAGGVVNSFSSALDRYSGLWRPRPQVLPPVESQPPARSYWDLLREEVERERAEMERNR